MDARKFDSAVPLGGGAFFLISAGLTVTGYINPPLGWTLILTGVIVFIVGLWRLRRSPGVKATSSLAILPLCGGGYVLDWVHLKPFLEKQDIDHCRRTRMVFAAARIANRGNAKAVGVRVRIEGLTRPLEWWERMEGIRTPGEVYWEGRSSDGAWSKEPGQKFVTGGPVEVEISARSDRLVIFAVSYPIPPVGGSWWFPDQSDLVLKRSFEPGNNTIEETTQKERHRFIGPGCSLMLRVTSADSEANRRFQLGFDGGRPTVKPMRPAGPPPTTAPE